MKKFLTLILSLFLASSSLATITRVQSTTATSGATASDHLTFTFGAAPSDADGKYHYLIIAICTANNADVIAPVSDANYTWMALQMQVANNANTALCVVRVNGTASTSITVNMGASGANNSNAGIAAEYKSDKPLRLDREQVSTGTGTSPSTGTTSATNNANELCVAALGDRLTSASTTGGYSAVTNSYSEVVAGGISTNLNTTNNDREVDLLEKFLSATGTTTTGATVASGTNWIGMVMTFEEMAGGTGSSSIPSI